MTSLLEQTQPTEEQNREALTRALEETLNDQMKIRQAQEAAIEAEIAETAKKRVEQDLGHAPQPIEPANTIENTLQALEKLKPEAKQHYLQQLIAQHYGIETKTQTEETIPYQTLEERIANYEQQIEGYPKKVGAYLNNKLYAKEDRNNLKLLTDACIIDKKDALIYEAAIKRIDKALNKNSLSDQRNFTFLRFIKKGAYCTATGALGLSLTSILTGNLRIVTVILPVLAFVIMVPFVAYGDSKTLNKRDYIQYKRTIAKHIKKRGQTLEQDLKVATEYAQKLQRQLENPAQINIKYRDSLVELAATKKQAEGYLTNSLETLTKINEIR